MLNDLREMKDVDQLCPEVYSSDISESEGVRLGKILSFIMQNYSNQITLEEVSEVAYMTPQAFCRYFKKHQVGTSFHF
ncbi:AraC-like DNA-binding protein [Pedobacter sp. UYP24]